MFGQFMSTRSSLNWECLGGAYMVISFNLNTNNAETCSSITGGTAMDLGGRSVMVSRGM